MAGNEQTSKSVSKLPWAVGVMYGDFNTFLRNTNSQISFLLSSSIDLTIEAIKKDCEGKMQSI